MGWRRESAFQFKGANDIVGIVMLENQGADNLPQLANSEFLSLLLVFFSYERGASSVAVEHVINVKNCLLCHHPRLNGKAEIDIIISLCPLNLREQQLADRLVMGNFVTASQEAQSK